MNPKRRRVLRSKKERVENSKRKKLEAESLHALTSSHDPEDHESAASMIERGADGNCEDAEGNTLLHVAVKSEAFRVIEALLKKSPGCRYARVKYDKTMRLILRRPNAAEFLELFLRYRGFDFGKCGDYLPWDMSDDHLARVVEAILRLAGGKGSAFESILECILLKNLPLAKHICSYEIEEKSERSIKLQTLLSYDCVSQNPAMVAFLVRQGADIHDCVNDSKEYPLHVACRISKPETVRLLLQLGADVNVIDIFGQTPFSLIHVDDTYVTDKTVRLMIQQFAYSTWNGEVVNENDLSAIRNNPSLQRFYETCVEELDRMKTIEAADGFRYCYFFSETNYKLSLLLKNPKRFCQLRKLLFRFEPKMFPDFKADMMTKFGVARRMKDILVSKERQLQDLFGKSLPCLVLRKIARYSLDLEHFEREYHLNKFS